MRVHTKIVLLLSFAIFLFGVIYAKYFNEELVFTSSYFFLITFWLWFGFKEKIISNSLVGLIGSLIMIGIFSIPLLIILGFVRSMILISALPFIGIFLQLSTAIISMFKEGIFNYIGSFMIYLFFLSLDLLIIIMVIVSFIISFQ